MDEGRPRRWARRIGVAAALAATVAARLLFDIKRSFGVAAGLYLGGLLLLALLVARQTDTSWCPTSKGRSWR